MTDPNLKPISVGDLVAIVLWPCCGGFLGAHFRVAKIERHPGEAAFCNKCGGRMRCSDDYAFEGYPKSEHWAAPLEWLKRIPPLGELEGQRTEEPLRLPIKETA